MEPRVNNIRQTVRCVKLRHIEEALTRRRKLATPRVKNASGRHLT